VAEAGGTNGGTKAGKTGRESGAIDPEKLRAKYKAEREKRLRNDANDQYIEIEGALAHFEHDPWVTGEDRRAPVHEDVDVLVIGGGFGGMLTAARLRQRGIERLRIVEKGGDFGGTWYWNRYPGIACDVESYIYLPLLEEVGGMPSEKYARGGEIFAHCRALARRFDLERAGLFRTEVQSLRWDETTDRWLAETDRGDRLRARFVALATGFLEKPKLPGIPGLESFAGKSFHTSRWDYAYTGGDERGGLTGLHDKTVGVIGTGATAVQCIPHLGASAGRLYVFQRTPASVDVRANRPTDPEWVRSLAPGWQRRRIENFQILTCGGYENEDLVADRWTDVPHRMQVLIREAGGPDLSPAELLRLAELADFEKMEAVRARVAEIVRDPATAEALKPWYRQFCKRPCFHDEYLPTFNRPNVTLVDTRGRGVERITPKGVVANGTEYALDCLIFATGFEIGTAYRRRAGFETVGRGGLTLSEKWRDRAHTFHGLHLHGFPNAFMLSLVHSGYTLNYPYLIDEQAKHVAWVIGEALARGARTVEASAEAEKAWGETIRSRLALGDPTFAEQCTPSYFNNEGQVDDGILARNFFVGGPTEFAGVLAAWRAEGTLEGLVLTPSA